MQYKITVCYKMEDFLYIYAYADIQLRIDCRCLVIGFLYSSGGFRSSTASDKKKNMAQLSASCAIFLCLTKNNFRNE